MAQTNTLDPIPQSGPQDVVVPASIVDALVQVALASDMGKGIIFGFRAEHGVPPTQMKLVVQDARLVPETGGRV